MSLEKPRRTWAEIDPEALRHNLAAARACLAGGTQIMAVVKANAYGHGLRHVVAALAAGTDLFGVANVGEALEVRETEREKPVFLLGPVLPDERPLVLEHGFIPTLSSLAEARAFAELGRKRAQPVGAHLAVDTGMGRVGFWQEEVEAAARELAAMDGLKVTGIASHLPSADEDAAFTQEQLTLFHTLAAKLRAEFFPGAVLHIDNSAGLLAVPALAGDIVRPGLMLYGSSPLPEYQPRLRPALTWKARVTLVRTVGPGRAISYGRTFITPRSMRIATLGVGYADGYQRHLTATDADVLLHGQRCRLLGRVTMDQILVDVSHLAEVQEGDEAVLLGRQGEEEIPAGELAAKAGTIPWEIFTGIGRRVERVPLHLQSAR
jgi:alanine racemase